MRGRRGAAREQLGRGGERATPDARSADQRAGPGNHLPDGLSGMRLQMEHEDAEARLVWRRDLLQEGMAQTLARMRAVLES